jgi:hypothetical protein
MVLDLSHRDRTAAPSSLHCLAGLVNRLDRPVFELGIVLARAAVTPGSIFWLAHPVVSHTGSANPFVIGRRISRSGSFV